MNEIIVTIGLPVYNAEIFIGDTIKSILNQSYKDFRLIILDDGSTDNSISIIKTFKDPRIELIVDGQNKGLPYRLNQLASLTKTKYLARMDADDIMHSDRIAQQLELLESNQNIDVLGTNAYSINEYNTVNGLRLNRSSNNELIKVNSFIHPTIMANTKWFKDNPYDEKAIRVEDAELWFRTSKKYNLYVITEPLLFYREFGEDYYKKYQKGIVSRFYISKKYMESFDFYSSLVWLIRGFKFIFKYLIYRLFNLFKLEHLLVNNRSIEICDTERKEANQSLTTSLQ